MTCNHTAAMRARTGRPPAITALNTAMPAEPIHVIYRSDDSGTTDNFQQYVGAAANGAWE
jgi:phosphate transport system substrate-binding protein